MELYTTEPRTCEWTITIVVSRNSLRRQEYEETRNETWGDNETTTDQRKSSKWLIRYRIEEKQKIVSLSLNVRAW